MFRGVYGVLFQGNVFLSHSYERSYVLKNCRGEVDFRRDLEKGMCKTAQNIFPSTVGNEKRVHCMWILFSKFKSF